MVRNQVQLKWESQRKRDISQKVLFLVLCVWLGVSALSAAPRDRHLHLGVLANQGKEAAMNKWSATADYLEQRLQSYQIELIPLDFDEVYHYVETDGIDFLITNAGLSAELEFIYGSSALATIEENYNGRGYTSYAAAIFTKADNDNIKNLQDLKNIKLAAVHELSFAGWQIGLRELRTAGLKIPRDLGDVVYTGTHDGVVMAVLNGEAEAGVVRTSTLETLAASGAISLSQIKIINPRIENVNFPWLHSTRLYPNWSFSIMPHTDPVLGKEMATLLISMTASDSAAVSADVTGWTVGLSYKPVLDCLRELGIGPFKGRKDLAFRAVFDAYRWFFIAGFLVIIILTWLLLIVIRLNRRVSKSNAALRSSEEKYRMLSEQYQTINENLSIGVSLISPEMQVVVANKQMREWFPSVNTQSVISCQMAYEGSQFGEVCEDCPVVKTFEDGGAHELLRKFERDGSPFFLNVTSTPIRDEEGKIVAALEMVEDVTVKVLFTEQIAEQNAVLEAVLDAMPDIVGILDPDLNIIRYNQTGLKLLGMDKDEVQGHKCWEVFDQDKACAECHIQETIKTKQSAKIERFNSKLGMYLDCRSQPVLDKDGKLRLIVEQVRDVTERKLREAELERWNRFQRLVADVSSEFISASIGNLDSKIDSMLRKAGEFFEVDQSYLILFSDNMRMMRITHSWYSSDVDVVADKTDYPTSLMPWWAEQIRQRKVVYTSSLSDIPEIAASEKEIYARRKIKTLISLPVVREDRVVGIFGMNSIQKAVVWEEKDITLLQVLSNTLSDALTKTESEKEILLAKDVAEAASKAKSEFLANMSHELRTPLNGVIGFTDLLLETPMNSQQKLYLENAHNSAHSLLEVISEILDFSKIEAGKLELEPVKTDIIELAESSMDVIVFQASRKDLELIIKIDPDVPRFAIVDPVRLKQVLINLLGNAVKFTLRGEIELRLSAIQLEGGKSAYSFSVSDTGIGIDPEKKDKLFEAFYQGDSSTTRKYGGTGLGLVISGLLIEKMNSKIKVESIPHQGSRFYFDLVLPSEHGEKGDYKELKRIRRILVVDDNDNNRTILEETLRFWGLEVVSCEGAISALATFHGPSSFDLMIVDYHMPDYDGLQTIKMIRNKLNGNMHPPCILYSSADDIFDKSTTDSLGINLQLFKPVKSKELYTYLQSLDSAPEEKRKLDGVDQLQACMADKLSKPATILIAEDNLTNMTLIKVLLKKLCPQVTIYEARNGREALETALNEKIDLVLMDVQMPEMDGIEATKQIRSVETITKEHLPIIALTAGALIEERERCLDAGMDEFLTKPLDQTKLKTILCRLLTEDTQGTVEQSQTSPAVQVTTLSFDEEGLMKRVSQDSDLMLDLINISLSQFPVQIELLEKAVQAKDKTEIKHAAHAIKGSALNMSLNRLGELALAMESAESELVDSYLESINKEWVLVRAILEGKLEKSQ